jgi:hypothetical protein
LSKLSWYHVNMYILLVTSGYIPYSVTLIILHICLWNLLCDNYHGFYFCNNWIDRWESCLLNYKLEICGMNTVFIVGICDVYIYIYLLRIYLHLLWLRFLSPGHYFSTVMPICVLSFLFVFAKCSLPHSNKHVTDSPYHCVMLKYMYTLGFHAFVTTSNFLFLLSNLSH